MSAMYLHILLDRNLDRCDIIIGLSYYYLQKINSYHPKLKPFLKPMDTYNDIELTSEFLEELKGFLTGINIGRLSRNLRDIIFIAIISKKNGNINILLEDLLPDALLLFAFLDAAESLKNLNDGI